jgi:N-carbamoylputrescine amidase
MSPNSTSSRFVLGLVQMSCDVDPAENLAQARERLREAAGRGAEVICLPELFGSQYFCQREDAAAFDLAEPIPGPTTGAMSALARELAVALIVPVFERRAPGLYHNSLVVIDRDGSLAGVYRKMHIPDDPAYYEKYYFTQGDLGFRSMDTAFGRIGTLICWDQWFPEAARLTALQGAVVICYPTAIGWHPHEKETLGTEQREAWRTVQRGHAIANGVYVASVNRVGLETHYSSSGAGLEFWGSSFVCDPLGTVIAEAACDREEILLAEIDTRRIEEVRRYWPFLRDRRIDAYDGISRRYLDG